MHSNKTCFIRSVSIPLSGSSSSSSSLSSSSSTSTSSIDGSVSTSSSFQSTITTNHSHRPVLGHSTFIGDDSIGTIDEPQPIGVAISEAAFGTAVQENIGINSITGPQGAKVASSNSSQSIVGIVTKVHSGKRNITTLDELIDSLQTDDDVLESGKHHGITTGIDTNIRIRDPSEVPGLRRCRYGDSDCIADMITIGLRDLWTGVPRLNLLRFDPLYAHKTLRMFQRSGFSNLVNLDFTFTDNEILGLSRYTCTHIQWDRWGSLLSFMLFCFVRICSGFGRNPQGRYEIRLEGPSLTLHGMSGVKGNLFGQDINGRGYSNFTAGEFHTTSYRNSNWFFHLCFHL